MRIGIFGGSFDPPHTGHVLAALDAIELLSLDRLQVVPVMVQPLKASLRTAAEYRLAMAQACFAGLPGVEVDPIEINRGGLSFTVDTVEAYRRRWPQADLHLLIGEDAVASFAQWRDPERLLSMVQLVVLSRSIAVEAVGQAPVPAFRSVAEGSRPPIRLATRRVDVSSTEIRMRVRNGLPIRGFVPEAVAVYIASTGLYLQEPDASADSAPSSA